MCCDCEYQRAIMRCEGCGGDCFCKLCFMTQHRKGHRLEHVPVALPGCEHAFDVAMGRASDRVERTTTIKQAKEPVRDEYEDVDSSEYDPFGTARYSYWHGYGRRGYQKKRQDAVTTYDVEVKENTAMVERARYIPMRLTYEERKQLRLLEATLQASSYTDRVDAAAMAEPGAQRKRLHEQVRGICSVLTGLLVGADFAAGREVDESHDYAAHADFFRGVFEIGRRYKIMNPEKMRTAYAKLMYILQDSMQPQIQDVLEFQLVAPLVTVYTTLERGGALNMLSDPLVDIATRECLARDPETGREKSRREVEADIKRQEKATEVLSRKYASDRITADTISQCLYSIKDNNSFLRCNRDPIDQAIAWLEELYGPNKPHDREEDGEEEAAGVQKKKQRKEEDDKKDDDDDEEEDEEEDDDDEDEDAGKKEESKGDEGKKGEEEEEEETLSLAIYGGEDGARLTHTHEHQYLYVMQSLTLWREIQHNMYRLWCLAEEDLLNMRGATPYSLRQTGQGMQRVQQAPQIYASMQAILQSTQRRVGAWVGSSVIHLGDEQVPNALLFIDKYTQVPRILGPIVLTINHVAAACSSGTKFPAVKRYIERHYGGADGARRLILHDFVRRAFDGSGADNFFDAGSCIDGRLTSAWQWCTTLSSKPFFPLFLLAGFVGFDGEWR